MSTTGTRRTRSATPSSRRPRRGRGPDYLWRVSGFQYWTSRIRTMLVHAAGTRDGTVHPAVGAFAAVVREARLHLASYVALAADIHRRRATPALLWLWVVPVVLGQPMLRLYLLAEHTGCPMVPNMLENSRTVHTSAVVRFLAWNMPYHAEHHAYAAIPFHALPRAHAALAPHIRVQSPGYAERAPRADPRPARSGGLRARIRKLFAQPRGLHRGCDRWPDEPIPAILTSSPDTGLTTGASTMSASRTLVNRTRYPSCSSAAAAHAGRAHRAPSRYPRVPHPRRRGGRRHRRRHGPDRVHLGGRPTCRWRST